jgi:hypothetical protein
MQQYTEVANSATSAAVRVPQLLHAVLLTTRCIVVYCIVLHRICIYA